MNIQVLTCDKLSHCLFDFDCIDLNIYERESYNYDFHLIKELRSTSEDTPDLTTHDCNNSHQLTFIDILQRSGAHNVDLREYMFK